MIKQATDFREECNALYKILDSLSDRDFSIATTFKNYTIRDVLAHLYLFDYAAELSLIDPKSFQSFANELIKKIIQGVSMITIADEWLKGMNNSTLLKNWKNLYLKLSGLYLSENPKTRIPWFGVEMSALSIITSRLMETWAHGQEVYDILEIDRIHNDSIKNIAVLGVNTFGWTFKNRNLDIPEEIPYLQLTAPSGEIWEWNECSTTNSIKGSAVQFCQVVTQVRNIADTQLNVVGKPAKMWMSIAQCFAGPAEDPPEPGVRIVTRDKV